MKMRFNTWFWFNVAIGLFIVNNAMRLALKIGGVE